LDHAEIEDPHGLASDATEWAFLQLARYEGGVLLKIGNEQDIDNAMPIIHQAFSLATTSAPKGAA
jgi:hypothetical protein